MTWRAEILPSQLHACPVSSPVHLYKIPASGGGRCRHGPGIGLLTMTGTMVQLGASLDSPIISDPLSTAPRLTQHQAHTLLECFLSREQPVDPSVSFQSK